MTKRLQDRDLASDALVARTALAVEQAGDGRTPWEPFAFAKPGSRAATIPRGQDLVIDPASHRRWDGMTATVLSVDPRQAAQLYRHVRPLFVETYRGMGHPDGNFDAAIARAAGRVLATPVLQAPIVVESRRGYVEHRSLELRSLPGISRQLLLMGPANVQRLRAARLPAQHGERVDVAAHDSTRAGTPPTVAPGSTSLTTAAPAPTTARLPIVMCGRTAAPTPTSAPASTFTHPAI